MASSFSASLLTFVVVASVGAVGWILGRSSAANAKKHDEEAATSKIEVVVDGDRGAAVAPVDALPSKRSLEATNRRQPVKSVLDRFSATNNNSEEDGSSHMPLQFPTRAVDVVTAVSLAGRAMSKPNNLSSFVRQCVSNIERASCSGVLAGMPTHLSSPRAALLSNQSDQSDSPPKPDLIEERRLPSLVTATDLDSTKQDRQFKSTEAPPDNAFVKPIFRRMSSLSGSKPPMLTPFMASKPADISESVKAATAEANPAMDSDDNSKSVDVVAPPLIRKGSASERLLQFQQLVPSNQARYSQGI